MPDQKLKDALMRLKEALADLDENDADSQKLLKESLIGIEKKLKEPQKGEERNILIEKLNENAVYFENKHPLVSNTLREISSILAHLGI